MPGAHSASSFRRRRVRTVGEGHPAAAGGSGSHGIGREPVSVDARGIEAAADWSNLSSAGELSRLRAHPELCVARRRRSGTSLGVYEVPAQLTTERMGACRRLDNAERRGRAEQAERPHRLPLSRARPSLVMGPAAPGAPVRFRVLIDGKPPGAAHGIDVDEQGNGTVNEQRLYQLIRQPGPSWTESSRSSFSTPASRRLRSRSADACGGADSSTL